EVTVSSLTDGRSLTFPTDYPFYTQASFSIVNDSLLFFNRYLGVEEYAMPGSGRPRKLLSGKKISRTFCDRAGSLWFTTLGSGIYRLISDEFRTVQLPENGMGVSAVETITVNRKGDALLVGDSHDAIFALRLRGMELARPALRAAYGSNRILFVHEFEHHRYVAGSDANVSTGTFAGIAGRSFAGGIKSACMVDDNRVLMGAPWGAAIFDLRRMAFTDTLWRGRITVVCHQQDTDYIGTLHGLWRIVKGRPPVFLGERDATLRNRISAMAEAADGVLWIASYDNIVTGYANGKVIATISQKNGLIGNICHCLLLHGRELWIGTDKGLNRIRLDRPGYPISCLTSRDGLSSDVVNSIYAIGSTVFVGTSAGLTYFDETKVQPGDECSLVLTAAISAGRDRIGDTAHLVLPVGENRLRFEYAGISYRSAGDITYRYRMIGLDSAWKETRSDFVDYQVLPPGKYLFQLQAVNKFGISSGLFSLPVQADAPYWQRGWFDALLAAACILSIWLGVTLRIRRIRRRHEERERVAQRMAELESTALQSQMNPHFIFNCLNSIQQYILDHEGLTANKYLTGFARIIRATLHNSSKAFIPLREEIDYLSTYLSLEKLRFKEKMDFTIEPDPGLDTNLYVIPPMLIQPFVENSMRHGLRHKTDGKGRILVRFSHLGNNLVVVVEDNGIGRKRAAGYKTREHIEYQSRGMSLTADRIRLINAKYNKSIQIEVADLEDGAGRPSGTRVTLRFPIFHQILQNEIL
ncbi:MAG TPA: histidine kinase, partial [Puia sp.]|nr:histidine kinase [Puia sp.]